MEPQVKNKETQVSHKDSCKEPCVITQASHKDSCKEPYVITQEGHSNHEKTYLPTWKVK